MATNIRHYLNYQYQNVSVLYVEDELFSREKLLRVLKRRFAMVHVAMDGEEGLELYKRHKTDIVIADIKMNQMSGLEMIQKIREINDKAQIIVTTAHDDNDFFIQSIENNVNHFILKPIDLERFLLAIQKSVYQIQLEQEYLKQKKLTRAILDFQDNLIFVIENDEIVEFNQAFSAFTGIEKSQPVHKCKSLSRFFAEDPNYYYPKNEESNWLNSLLTTEKNFAKVRWIGKDGSSVIYYLKVSPIPGERQILIVCTDITALEEESKKNEILAMMDPLTNSYNRLKFDDILTSEISRSERYKHPFSIILMDIDYFKDVNDQFGHQAGDEVLVTISTIIQQRIRECDIFARWGGEKFILLTPNTNEQGAAKLAESIRLLVENFSFNRIGPLTCSFGVAEFVIGKPKRELILEADQALYKSKNRGRNCVSIYNYDS
ncbi:diguanylate cyclase [Neobacillus sp. FSL H8-0543]|uniref:GGDEF domain-containing response regulator n=1 Tax=Neobacillus sp. FSL H8-0543 TaxID=2954672 RepID=UPI0031598490